MAHLGIRVKALHEEEYCLIPMGGVLPRVPQRVLGIGGTAGMVHPSTGGCPEPLYSKHLRHGALLLLLRLPACCRLPSLWCFAGCVLQSFIASTSHVVQWPTMVSRTYFGRQ